MKLSLLLALLALAACGSSGDEAETAAPDTHETTLPDVPPVDETTEPTEGIHAGECGGDACGVPDTTEPPPADVVDVPPEEVVPSPHQTFLLAGHVYTDTDTAYSLFGNSLAAADERCGMKEIGPCFVFDCRGATDVLPPLADAGAITVSRAGGGATATLTPDADGVYLPATATGTPWEHEDLVSFSAAGGADLPAFTENLLFPDRPQILTPDLPLPLTAGVVIERAQGFTATWTPTDESMVVSFQQGPLGNDTWLKDLQLVCFFDAAAGTGTVPPEVLGLLAPSTQGGLQSGLLIAHATFTDLVPGGIPLRVVAWYGRSAPWLDIR